MQKNIALFLIVSIIVKNSIQANCPAGQVTAAGSSDDGGDPNSCVNCAPGFYSSPQLECTACSDNKFSVAALKATASNQGQSCILCADGYYSADSSTCTGCPAGYKGKGPLAFAGGANSQANACEVCAKAPVASTSKATCFASKIVFGVLLIVLSFAY
ncbi:hypothetical protein IMG5_150200 [Ichthyophthirius multifiliis]|uniref:Tyrosine-protein kinase ephrin type A/B receptor-like domain-containing protein n=1 Tax=Ichthyophthirius multifiliis TaxID=5932 RepID=G0QYJ5_ICHMU|nr:hypothetical protein IMG5_150200 [Ichthyophthirius multifiliis]EGR29702.1 hypothetical protein IMG5_150200 [Ichthyophthirius multifiliis]|eukprot:XP_004030938.1 hypothetical protein IMG5_150200 [Ichthyophthirius multifiliis]